MSALTGEQQQRALALCTARDMLLVKSGQYAERPIDPFDLIRVAAWVLDPTDDEPVEVASWVAGSDEEDDAYRRLRSTILKQTMERAAGLS